MRVRVNPFHTKAKVKSLLELYYIPVSWDVVFKGLSLKTMIYQHCRTPLTFGLPVKSDTFVKILLIEND